MEDFVHLHLHTEYSLGDSIVRMDALMDEIKNLGMSTVAITDHGTLGGVHKFWSSAKQHEIKPIIGCEIYVNGEEKKRSHLTVIAKNKNGYLSIVKALNSMAKSGKKFLEDKDVFEMKDVVVLSGCLSGKIPRFILSGEISKARNIAQSYLERFGEDFYIEIMRTGLKEQKDLNMDLLDLAKELKIKVVATNDIHFIKKADALSHGLFVSMGRNMRWDGTFAYGSDEYYLKSPDEMKLLFDDLPPAIENTLEISSKCTDYDLKPDLNLPLLSEDDCKTIRNTINLEKLDDQKLTRVKKELKLIESKRFCTYFLTVSNIIRIAEKLGILIGPGRGSSVSSLVSYLLGITSIDPLKYDLLFERFLNESRTGDPDIDIDVEDDQRGTLISALSQNYGVDHIAQVGAYGTLGSRAVVRSAGKSLGLSDRVIEDIAWRVSGYGTISEALSKNQELKKISQSVELRNLMDYSVKLEGLVHHKTTHAAGIIISKEEINDTIPLTFDGQRWITEFDMESLADLEVTKIDLLGLKTLTNIKDTLGSVTREDLMRIPVEDPRIYDILKKGNTVGIFQLESTSATSLTKKLSPENFNDVIALLSLNRPGPMYSGVADEYVRRRHGGSVMKDEFGLDSILKDTYGMMIYQEQIMKIANDVAGFSGEKADMFRKSISKKDPVLMEDLKSDFVKGCVANGYAESKALRLFETISNFASYGFNKSHSVAYAYITVWTSYLKATKPSEFISSLMNSNISEPAKLLMYEKELNKLSIKLLPPDINESKTFFYSDAKTVRIGFAAIKGVGTYLGHIIEEERAKERFENFQDFVSRTRKKINVKALESLILSGTFDSTDPNRKYLMDNLEMIVDLASGGLKIIQQQLFENGSKATLPSLENYPDYDLNEKIKLQRQYLEIGLNLSHSDGFARVIESGFGKVSFQIFENEGKIFATDGENEVAFSYSEPLKEGETYEGEFTYKNGSMILSKLIKSSETTYIYIKDPTEMQEYMQRIVEMKGHHIVFKFEDLSLTLDDKTLKEEEY
jgi:DNA polymerase-3 subunit alpha